jgi:hypothetical protein
LVIISQVQIQNNEKWKKETDANSTEKQFESDTSIHHAFYKIRKVCMLCVVLNAD